MYALCFSLRKMWWHTFFSFFCVYPLYFPKLTHTHTPHTQQQTFRVNNLHYLFSCVLFLKSKCSCFFWLEMLLLRFHLQCDWPHKIFKQEWVGCAAPVKEKITSVTTDLITRLSLVVCLSASLDLSTVFSHLDYTLLMLPGLCVCVWLWVCIAIRSGALPLAGWF